MLAAGASPKLFSTDTWPTPTVIVPMNDGFCAVALPSTEPLPTGVPPMLPGLVLPSLVSAGCCFSTTLYSPGGRLRKL
ncbi:hypothetical protein D3C81_1401900 [compost metagenome]